MLVELGKTLAQLGISVESAARAGLLGGLSASDVTVLSDAHSREKRTLALHARLQGSQQEQALRTQTAAEVNDPPPLFILYPTSA